MARSSEHNDSQAVGLLLGAALQVALQIPGLRDGFSSLRFKLDLNHPGLRRVLKLYAPIVVSTIISQLAIYFALGWPGVRGRDRLDELRDHAGTNFRSAWSAWLCRRRCCRRWRDQAAGGQDVRPTLVQGLNLVVSS